MSIHWMVILESDFWMIIKSKNSEFTSSEIQEMDNSTTDYSAEACNQLLDEMGYRGESILIGLGSSLCVSQYLQVPNTRQAKNRQMMSYLMEPNLPWSAEETAIDYEIWKNHAFMVGTHLEPLSQLISYFEQAGKQINSVVPMGRVVLNQQLNNSSSIKNILLWEHQGGIEFWCIENGHPTQWQLLPTQSDDLIKVLKLESLKSDNLPDVICRDLSEELIQELKSQTELNVIFDDQNKTDYLATFQEESLKILKGNQNSILEFRQDSLVAEDKNRQIRSSLNAFQIALMFLMIMTGSALLIKSNQFEKQRITIGDQQAEVYRELFPDQRVPVGIKAMLQSEYQQLMSKKGAGIEFPESTKALEVLEKLFSSLKSISEKIRFRIRTMEIHNGKLQISGDVRSPADASLVVKYLDQTGLLAEPAKTTHREKGFSFSISAKFPDSTAVKGDKI